MNVNRRTFLRGAAAASALAALHPASQSFDAMASTGSMKWVKGVCRYCGTGCGLYKGVMDGKLVAVKGDKDNHNKGFLCLKGFLLPQMIYGEDRLTKPLVRKDGRLVSTTWDEAMKLVTSRFMKAAEQDPDSVAFYGSGQAYTEESYVANKIWRAGFRTNNIDGNPRLCMASAVGGYVTTFGKDEPMGTYEDIHNADVLFIIGSNTAEAHPVIYQQIVRRKAQGSGVKIIVADPRRTPTSRIADLHMTFKPNTDLAILNAMAHVLVNDGLIDEKFIKTHLAFGEGATADKTWEQYTAHLEKYTPEYAEGVSGCPKEDIVTAARWFGAEGRPATSMWTMGLNQRTRGVWANNLVHNLHLITGKIGTPGSTSLSLTGQPNACGGVRDQGGLAHLLPYGRLAANPTHRAEMEKLWKLEPGTLPARPGQSAIEMFRAVNDGNIRCLWVMCTNPGQSLPNVERYREGMRSEDTFLVVSDIYPTRTTELADVVLPAAAWSEKEGVFGCTERRYQLDAKAVDPPGQARPDFDILCDFARRCGFGQLVPFKTPAGAWEEILQVAAGTPYQIGGITRKRLQQEPGVIWPAPAEDKPGARLRYVKGEDPWVSDDWPHRICFYGKPDNRAVVWMRPLAAPEEIPDETYPFYLTTGRVLEHWHTGTMTMRVKELRHTRLTTELEIHPADAERLKIKSGDKLRVVSRRGSVVVPALVSENSAVGLVFMHMHDPDRMCNVVTIDAFDPGSKEPEYKICAVRIEKA